MKFLTTNSKAKEMHSHDHCIDTESSPEIKEIEDGEGLVLYSKKNRSITDSGDVMAIAAKSAAIPRKTRPNRTTAASICHKMRFMHFASTPPPPIGSKREHSWKRLNAELA